jgi:hypothetical protein
MTRLADTPKSILEERRNRYLRENITYLNTGEWSKYCFNCKRIAKITVEMNRRENAREEWR